MTAAGEPASSLALLLEASPEGWAALERSPASGAAPLGTAAYVQQVLAFINAYLLLSEAHELAVWAVGAGNGRLLWATPSLAPALGRPASSHVPSDASDASVASNSAGSCGPAAAVLAGLADLAAVQADAEQGSTPGAEPAWSATVGRALCLLRKASRGVSSEHEALSQRQERQGPPPRLLCLKAAPDAPPQYLASMNAAFSAQRCGVLLDACVLGAGHSPFLQQAAHLTGGIYLQPSQPAGLLQVLLTAFLPDPGMRDFIALPRGAPVDLRASCFCHRRPVDIGYACSVCLSVFCERGDECFTCGTRFERQRPPAGSLKRPAPSDAA